MSRNAFTRNRAVAVGAALLITAGAAGVAVASGEDVTHPGKRIGAQDAAHPAPAAKDAAPAKAKPREAAALTGSAKLFRKTTEDVTFTFDAHLAAKYNDDPSKATGTFEFVHLDKPGGKGGWAKGRIDCLVTGGKVASVTGIITKTNIKDIKGGRVGFSVHDKGPGKLDRAGYSWGATGGPTGDKKLPKCNSAAPFEVVKKGTGDFHVAPWNPPYPEGD
ncbi:Repetin [Streptomyces flavofungini]|uniref:Repetin n=1 Tax=Streptomyces flavofungini TaxID=68200 RepID=UPI0025B1C49D|nr:Repetin [Streptomyces flavofungini]WJV50072.1 Repetin [Streptomyces flavofungini]